MEKLQKVYDVFVRDGHISDPAKTPFDKWAASFSDKPEKKEQLYDFLVEKQYIKQKPKDQWIGETFGAATPAVVDQKKKTTPEQGAGLPVSQPQSKTASVVTPQSKPAVSPAKPTYLYGKEKEVVTPTAGGKTPIQGLGGAPMTQPQVEGKPMAKAEAPTLSPSKKILEANKDKQWVDRVMNPSKYPSIKGKNGEDMTHRLSYAEQDGKFYVFPEIQYDPKTGKLNDYTDREKYGWTAMDNAMKSGEAIEFKTEKEAADFTKNYKKGTPLEAMYGGPQPLQKEKEQANGMKEMFQKFQDYRNQATIAAQKNTMAEAAGDIEYKKSQRDPNPDWAEQQKYALEDAQAAERAKVVSTQPLVSKMLDYYDAKAGDTEWEDNRLVKALSYTSPPAAILAGGPGGMFAGDRDDSPVIDLKEQLIGTPEGATLEQELQKIYKRTNLKDQTSVDNALLDAKQLMFEKLADKDVTIWDDFAQTNKAMADYNPQAYHKRLEGQIEKKYGMAGMDKGVAYTKLMDYSLGRGVMDEERTAEAKAVLNVRTLRDEVSRAEREGSVFRIDQAKQKLAAAEKEVQAMESNRLSALDKRVAIIQDLIVNETDQERIGLLKKDLDLAKAQRAGFINPNAQIMATYAKVQDQADAVSPKGTPMEKLQKLYAELEFDRQQIMGRIQQAEAKGGALGFAVQEMINSVGGQGHNDDHRRLIQIESQIKDLAPIVFLNENPIVQDKKAGFFPAFNTGLMSSLAGQGSPLSNTQRQEDAIAIARNLQIAGVSPEALNDPTMLGIKDRMEEPGLFSGEYLGQLSGQSTGLMASIMATTALTKGVGLGTAINRAVTWGNKALGLTGKSGMILPLLGDAIESGINYEGAGRISVDNNDELDFLGGFLGGAAASAAGAGTNSALNSFKNVVSKWFGDKGQEAVGMIVNFGASRLGSGTGELSEEFGQQIGQLWEASSTGQEFWKRMDDQFGSLDKATKFVVSTMIMGAFMGGAHSGGLGEYLTNLSKEQLAALPPEQRPGTQAIVDQVASEQAAFVEGGLNPTPEDVASVEAEQEGIEPEKKKQVLTPEAQAAQAELERRAAIDKTMVEQGLGDRVNTAQSQEDRLREERDALVAQQERQELTDNEKKRLADLETVVTGLDQIAAGEQFVSPAPEVETETIVTNSGEAIKPVEGSDTKKRVTLDDGTEWEADIDMDEMVAAVNTEDVKSLIAENFMPATEEVAVEGTPTSPAPVEETVVEENPFGEPTPREQPKRRDQQIVDQINEFFNNLAGAIGENAVAKIKEYADRVIADPKARESIIKGLPKKWIDSIDEAVALQQQAAPATDESIIDVTEEAPTPIAAEDRNNTEGHKSLNDFLSNELGETQDWVSDLPIGVESWTDAELEQYPITKAYKKFKQETGLSPKIESSNKSSVVAEPPAPVTQKKGKGAATGGKSKPKANPNRITKSKPVADLTPTEVVSEAIAVNAEVDENPTTENKEREAQIEERIESNVVSPAPAPKPKKSRGKQQALPEGVEELFHEATISGRRTSWMKKDGKWFFRNHKPGTKISEQQFERDWQEATGKDIAKAERLAAMDSLDLDVANAAKEWVAAWGDFVKLKWGMKGAAFSRVDLGLMTPVADITLKTFKLGIAVAKKLAEQGKYTKARWEESMIKYVGEHIRPMLPQAWENTQQVIREGATSAEDVQTRVVESGEEANEKSKETKKKKEPVEDSGEKTGTQKLMEKYISKAGEVLAKVIANSPMLKSVYDQKAQYEKALKEVKEAIAANKVGQLMARLMEASTTDNVDVDQFQRMILVDMYNSLTDNATEVRNRAAVTGDKAAEKQAQKDIDRFTTNTTSMLNAMDANALGAGRGGAASGMWRFIGGSMDTYAMGVIDKANRAIAKSKKTANGKTLEETSKEIADNLNEEKKKKANEIADSVDGAIDNGVNQSKPKRKSSTIAGKTAAEFAELKRQAKEKYDSIRLGGTMNAILSPNGFAKTAAAAEFGYYALLEGAVTFKDWVASMKKDLPDLTDQELEDIWNSELNGRTLSEESKNVLREKALKSINSALSSSERTAENTDSAKEAKKLRDQMAKDLAATIEAGESIDDFKKKYGLTDEQAEDLSESIAKADQAAIDKLAGKKIKGFDPKVYLPKPKTERTKDEKAEAKKKAETRAKVKEVIRDHFANPDGQPLIDKLTEAGLDLEQAQKVEQAVRDNAQVILAQAVAGELDHIQSGESKRKNKDYKPPKKGGKKRTQAEILIDNLVDGNITDRFVQGLVRHKFGMGRTATAEEVARLRKLGKAVKEAQAGSVFEKMAMKELATLIDPLLPRKKSSDLSALLNGLTMSSVLNSVNTMLVNPYSVTDHWFIGSIKPLGDPQQWADLFNALIKKDGGNPALLNPLAKMLNKMMAGYKPALSGMESFASGMITGTTSGKYDESVMDSDPSKMLPALEREQRTAFGRALTAKKWWNPYSHIFGKTIGRILSATDAGMTMAYGDLEFLDAMRVAIGKKPNGSIAELKQLAGEYLSQKSQLWQDSLQQAQDEAAAMEALTGKHVPDVTTEVRAREIVRKKFASDPRVMLDESELASIQKVAQYNTLTLKRQGGFGKAAEVMAKLKGGDEKWQKILKGVLWPFILFTEIPGNFGDALLDNTPVYNILRAIGLSPTGIAKRMGWTETSAMIGETGSRERRKQLEQIFFSNILFLAVFALIGTEDDDDRFVTSKEINSDESYQFFGIPYRAFASLAPSFILARVLRDSEKDPKYKTMSAPEAAYMQVTSAMTALSGFYTDQSFMKGIQDFGRLATTLAEFSKGETTNQAAFRAVIRPYLNLAAKPLPQTQGITRFILDCFDPHKYTEEDWSEMFAMTIGMERINNEKKIGLFGEEYLVYPGNNVLNVKSLIDKAAGDHPMKKQYEFLARTKTFIKAPTNPVAKFLDPKSSTGFTFREFTPSEWYKLNKKAGEYFLKDLNTYMNSKGVSLGGKIDVANNKLISQTQTDILKKWSEARSKAKKELFGKILLSDTEAQKLLNENFPENK